MGITRIAFIALVLAGTGTAGDQAKNSDEVEIIAATLKAESAANQWKRSDAICISLGPEYPSKALLAALRQRKLNVRSVGVGTWCEFQVLLQPPRISSNEARILLDSADCRGILAGKEDLAIILHKGEYFLRKSGAKWNVLSFIPDKNAP
jgi:hypothetical protein